MLNLLKKIKGLEVKKVENFKVVDGRVCLVKEWPCKSISGNSWGRSGYDSLYN
jgi:hypothetical protein